MNCECIMKEQQPVHPVVISLAMMKYFTCIWIEKSLELKAIFHHKKLEGGVWLLRQTIIGDIVHLGKLSLHDSVTTVQRNATSYRVYFLNVAVYNAIKIAGENQYRSRYTNNKQSYTGH